LNQDQFLNKVFQSQFLFDFEHYFTTGGAGTANPSGAPDFTQVFRGVVLFDL
jgi:hypothetical protein